MNIQQTTPAINDTEKQQSWDKFQSQYGAKPKAQRQVKKTLDKDDFLKIMITQMQHQDPTEPFAADKLAQEIAQISSVEQLSNVNKALTELSKKNEPLERLTMTHLIGKTVTVDPNRFSHETGYQSNIPYQLEQDAESVKLTVLSSSGEVVLNKDLGAQKAGKGSFLWNGIKENSLPAGSDVYMINIEAVSKEGKPVTAMQSQKTKIIGVSYTGKEPSFIVGDSKNYTRVPMKNIIQIDETEVNKDIAKPLNMQMGADPSAVTNPFQMAAQKSVEKPVAPSSSEESNVKAVAPVQEKGFLNGLSPQLENKENL